MKIADFKPIQPLSDIKPYNIYNVQNAIEENEYSNAVKHLITFKATFELKNWCLIHWRFVSSIENINCPLLYISK